MPKQIRVNEDNIDVTYQSKHVIFEKFNNVDTLGWLEENFVREQYKTLNVKDKNVIDLGCSMGDTPIYFACNGANHVYGYDTEKSRALAAIRNVKRNHMDNQITIYNKAFDAAFLDTIKDNGWVMKIDIDGPEYELIMGANDSQIKKLEEIIIEYGKGYKEIEKRLKDLGFMVNLDKPLLGQGILYAKRIKKANEK